MKRRIFIFMLVSTTILAVGTLATCMWVYHGHERFFPKRWGVVETNAIYRSGRLTPYILQRMVKRHQIRVLIDLTAPDEPTERALAAQLKVTYFNFPLYGNGVGELEHYVGAVTTIVMARQQRQPVLVYCAAGVQRTGGVIAMYRVLVEDMSPDEALQELRSYGWTPRKNMELISFLNDMMGDLAARLAASATIPQVPQPLPQFNPEACR